MSAYKKACILKLKVGSTCFDLKLSFFKKQKILELDFLLHLLHDFRRKLIILLYSIS